MASIPRQGSVHEMLDTDLQSWCSVWHHSSFEPIRPKRLGLHGYEKFDCHIPASPVVILYVITMTCNGRSRALPNLSQFILTLLDGEQVLKAEMAPVSSIPWSRGNQKRKSADDEHWSCLLFIDRLDYEASSGHRKRQYGLWSDIRHNYRAG